MDVFSPDFLHHVIQNTEAGSDVDGPFGGVTGKWDERQHQ
ncbi:hypothetical protein ZBT109_0845 [Zymobacter palmae]|uniref:Uncharacterized protein n=1 Tax=Zymobacter palmae TaxID=33074 RepID=A0A348HDB9_9GAMM|nr:hypothetical protein ZBT109_0845 [Zymobacter palmae]